MDEETIMKPETSSPLDSEGGTLCAENSGRVPGAAVWSPKVPGQGGDTWGTRVQRRWQDGSSTH